MQAMGNQVTGGRARPLNKTSVPHNHQATPPKNGSPAPAPLGQAALAYARAGYEVLPLHYPRDGGCSCGLSGCQNPAKHPLTRGRGVRDATKEEKRVSQWWANAPRANIGLHTSRMLALDIDARHGGDESLRKLIAQYGELPTTVQSITGGGGRHIFFRHPGSKIKNQVGLLPGIDVRAKGGYIVAPPSLHSSGASYQWDGPGLHEQPPAELPAWLHQMLASGNAESAAGEGGPVRRPPATPEAGPIPEGSRDAELTRIAGRFHWQGLSGEALEEALHALNQDRCIPPLPAAQIRKIACSISKRPCDGRPRTERAQKPDLAQSAPELVYKGEPYEATKEGLIWWRSKDDGHIPVKLTNFGAQIVGDILKDDGTEGTRFWEIEATLNGSRRSFRVPATQFAGMNWPAENLGAGAIVAAGTAVKEHARVAIQTLSTGAVRSQARYTHTGWRKVGTDWVYLHAGGGIGALGKAVGVEVELSEHLQRYRLPDDNPLARLDLRDAVTASLRFLELCPDWIVFPIYAAIWRAALRATRFSIHLSGPTGTGKTELAALAQQHFGPEMDAEYLPGFWSSTSNALEALAFEAKDSLLVIDDFAPTGSSADIQRIHRESDRLLRAQGNHSARQRLRADTTFRPAKPPRGMILSTGEDAPRGESLRARLLVLDIGPDDLNWDKLTICQTAAHRGEYALAMAGFLQWLSPRYGEVEHQLREEILRFRSDPNTKAAHRRAPDNIANLAIGFRYFLAYTVDTKTLSKEQAEQLWGKAQAGLQRATVFQQRYQCAADPTVRFLELLSSALATGRGHVAGTDGCVPTDSPKAWGWRQMGASEWRPGGNRVGWVDGEELYLDPIASHMVAQQLARDGEEPLPVSLLVLKRRLKQKGLLASTDSETLTVRRTLEEGRRKVLHLHAASLSPSKKPGQPGQDAAAPLPWPGSWPGFDVDTARKTATDEPVVSTRCEPVAGLAGFSTGRKGSSVCVESGWPVSPENPATKPARKKATRRGAVDPDAADFV